MRAFLFPGQGAQSVGMGKAFADAYPAAKAVFEEVDDALGEKLSALIWDGPAGQPAGLSCSYFALKSKIRLLFDP